MSRTAVQPNAALTARIINPALTSVIETFDLMLGVAVERGRAELRADEATMYEVSALIGISGRAKGSVCISFERETALGVVERFLGDRPDDICSDTIDALGEIANMVGGATKSKLNMGLNIGLPNVIHGNDHAVEFPSESKPMRVYFESDIGPFCVDFGFVIRDL